MEDQRWLSPFRFRVDLEPSDFEGLEELRRGQGAFAEVQGLEISLEAVTFREGGYNQGPRQLIGKTSTQPLVLKRGLSLDTGFWSWVQRCGDGRYPLPYVNGTVRCFPPGADPLGSGGPEGTWKFVNAIATKVTCAAFNARQSSEVALEELHLVHEGLRRVLP
ncbi:MAG: phage tail protein [Cyanobacteriota bacterium]|jgi:phage tail-like protein